MLNYFVKKRVFRIGFLVALYLVISGFAFFVSYMIRFDAGIPEEMLMQRNSMLPWVILIQTSALVFFGQATALPKYFSIIDLRSMVLSSILSTIVLMFGMEVIGIYIPRGIRVLNFMLFISGLTGARLFLRILGERHRTTKYRWDRDFSRSSKPAAIVGAGSVGASLAREILNKPGLGLKPIAFFDDDKSKWGHHLHGIPIVGPPEEMLEEVWSRSIRKIIISIPTASLKRLQDIARISSTIGVVYETIPEMEHLVTGKLQISQTRPINIADLLRRPAVALDKSRISSFINHKVVAVTGAGGSIGSEIARQILASRPRRIILIDQSEAHLFQIEQELCCHFDRSVIVSVIADICDENRVLSTFKKYQPNIVFHAAAYKHVPMMEGQPVEAIRNNTFGTVNLVKIADKCCVERFVMISTDKAINPTNIMGASKRMAELYLQAFHSENPGGTRFMAVRFGNVLGSSGSVVPTFQRQIAAGGPVTVTHPDVTRYFMTIPEAVALVLQAGQQGVGGEIFVLDMGEPIKIVELAEQMINLSGFVVGEGIKIEFTGLRPGEKMYEEISHQREQLISTKHSKIFEFRTSPQSVAELEERFLELENTLAEGDCHNIKESVRLIVPEYKPFGS